MREGWEYKKLGEIIRPAKVVKNGEKKDLPILSITMHDGIVLQASRFKKTIASVDTSTYKVVKNGQLVIAFPIDEGLIYTQDIVEAGIMSPAYNIWDVDFTNINRKFLTIYLHCPYAMNYYKSKLRGTTMRRRSIPREDLLNMPLPVPSLSTQESIVSELDKINELISLKKEQLKDYDNLAQSIFYDMFGDPVANDKGWDQKRIGDICVDKKDIKRASKCFNGSHDIQYIDISSIDNSSNCVTGATSFSFEDAPSRAQQKVENGDILVSLVRPNLKNIAIVNLEGTNLVASSGFCILRAAKSSNYFIKALVLTPHFTQYLINRVSGANYPAVREDDIKNCLIGVPPLPLQQAFAKRIEAIEQQKQLISSEIKDLETLLASRMQYWFD